MGVLAGHQTVVVAVAVNLAFTVWRWTFTRHMWFDYDGCDPCGCDVGMTICGQFHMRAEFCPDWWMHPYFNGNKISGFNTSNAADSVRDTMKRWGVVFSYLQWTGWSPNKHCERRPGQFCVFDPQCKSLWL